MADEVRVVWNDAEIHAIARQEYARRELASHGGQLADTARAGAPRRTGAGADSIRAETVFEDAEWTVRVAWDALHAYMRFPELGTKTVRAQHFLLHAADRYARP